MVQIEQIIVDYDPLDPGRDSFELSVDEVADFDESFYTIDFRADVFLTDGSSYMFAKKSEGLWESYQYSDNPDGDLPPDFYKQYEGSFSDALNILLDQVNLNFSKS